MITRRSILSGLIAAPAVVAASSLMPIRGIILPIDGHEMFRLRSFYNNMTQDLWSRSDYITREVAEQLMITPKGVSQYYIEKFENGIWRPCR